jgi:hypothetical protein
VSSAEGLEQHGIPGRVVREHPDVTGAVGPEQRRDLALETDVGEGDLEDRRALVGPPDPGHPRARATDEHLVDRQLPLRAPGVDGVREAA